jgi:hypothetical protein
MPRYHVVGKVSGSKYLGEFEADSPGEAIEKAIAKNGMVCLCHRCSAECEDAEVDVDPDTGAELIEEDPPPVPKPTSNKKLRRKKS